MNSACLAQGSASMWAARGRIARALGHSPISSSRLGDREFPKDSSELTRSVFVNAVSWRD